MVGVVVAVVAVAVVAVVLDVVVVVVVDVVAVVVAVVVVVVVLILVSRTCIFSFLTFSLSDLLASSWLCLCICPYYRKFDF